MYNTVTMSSITVNVNTNAPTNADIPAVTRTVDEAVRAEAKRRLEAMEAEQVAAARLVSDKEKQLRNQIDVLTLEEQVRARVKEEQIRILAQQAAAEAEARRIALANETAIAAEMERLRNRTKTEILEDTVADLKAQLASLKTVHINTYRQ